MVSATGIIRDKIIKNTPSFKRGLGWFGWLLGLRELARFRGFGWFRAFA
jgi:hypothetical protein